MGVIVRAITIESKHSWREIKTQTKFSDKELNFHLAQLFNEGAIKKERSQYYVIPSLEAEWLNFGKLLDEPVEVEAITHTINKNASSSTQGNRATTIILIALLVLSVGFNITILSKNTEQTKLIQGYLSTIETLQNDLETLNNKYKILQSQNDELKSHISELSPSTNPTDPSSSTSSSSTSSSSTPSNPSTSSSSPSTSQSVSTRTVNISLIATCTKVFDGDTFELSSGKVVRLADINAPESNEQGYASSSNALSSWILGKQVYLDIDSVSVTDSYGRYVCVVYISSGSGYTNVNQALLTGGYASLSDYSNEFDPSTWSTSFVINTGLATQDSSKSSSSGISSSSGGSYWGSKNSNIYHKPSCYWAQQISSSNLVVFGSRSAAESAGYRACKVCNP